METTFSNFPFLDWRLIVSHLAHVAVAYALALPVAWDREQETRSAGLRTFPLVAVASCGFILLAARVMGDSLEAQSRVIQGVIPPSASSAAAPSSSTA